MTLLQRVQHFPYELWSKLPQSLQSTLMALSEKEVADLKYFMLTPVEEGGRFEYLDREETLSKYIDLAMNSESESETYRKEKSQQIKVGKLFQKLGVENPQELEKLTALFKPVEFRVVSGEDIRKWYLEDNYSFDKSTSLTSSCMRGYDQQDYMDIYVENARMVIATNPFNKLIARAILWDAKIEKNDESITVLDRIYGEDCVQHSMKGWAKRHGYYCKEKQNYDSIKQFLNPAGDSVKMDILVEICNTYGSYPYMDTMLGMSVGTSGETVTLHNSDEYQYHLRSTEGEPNDVG